MIPTPTHTPRTNPPSLATAILLAAPPLAALAAWSVPQLLTMGQHPLAWLGGIAAAAVTLTTLAAVAAASPQHDPERMVWPLLLGWPLAYPLYMARRGQTASGLAGTLLLCGALAWSGWQVRQGEQAVVYLLQASGEQNDRQASGEATGSDGLTQDQRDAFNRARIQRILDAEAAAQPPR